MTTWTNWTNSLLKEFYFGIFALKKFTDSICFPFEIIQIIITSYANLLHLKHNLLSCGGDNTLYVHNNQLYGWGEKFYVNPKQIPIDQVISVCSGFGHFMVISTEGLHAWGNNHHGQLGTSGTSDVSRDYPAKISIDSVVAISCGTSHTIAITKSALYAWGLNSAGQLGLGHNENCHQPRKIPDLKSILSVSCGGTHTVAITTTGNLYAWGLNKNGQLGLGHTYNCNSPRKINIDRVDAISCGDHCTMAIINNELYGWGFGHGINSPQKICIGDNLPKVLAVSCGSDHLMIRTTDGLYAWGSNERGQLGTGNNINYSQPQKIDLADVLDVGCGRAHTMAITKNGSYYWGSNEYRQLYLHGGDDYNIPHKLYF